MAKSSIQLNVRNWIGDTRKLSLEARGLLIDLMCHMHKEPDLEIPPPPGHERMTAKPLASLVSSWEPTVLPALDELEASGLIFYTTLGHMACKLFTKRRPQKTYASPVEMKKYRETADAIYKDWPHPGDKDDSINAVIRLLATKVISPEELIARAERCRIANEGKDPQFVKMLVRWIKKDTWELWAEKDATTGSASDEFNKHWGRATK